MAAACCDLHGPQVCYLLVGPSSAHPGGGFPPCPGAAGPTGREREGGTSARSLGRCRSAQVAAPPGGWPALSPHRAALPPTPALQPLPAARGPPPAAPAGPAQDRGGAGHPEGPPGGSAAPHTPARAGAELPGRPDPAGPGVGEARLRPRGRGRGESWGPAWGRGPGEGADRPWAVPLHPLAGPL